MEGNIVRLFGVVLSVEDKNVLFSRFYVMLWFSLLAGISLLGNFPLQELVLENCHALPFRLFINGPPLSRSKKCPLKMLLTTAAPTIISFRVLHLVPQKRKQIATKGYWAWIFFTHSIKSKKFVFIFTAGRNVETNQSRYYSRLS